MTISNPALHDFREKLRRLKWVEPHLVGLTGPDAKKFEADPYTYLIRSDEKTAAAIWGAIQDTPARFATSA